MGGPSTTPEKIDISVETKGTMPASVLAAQVLNPQLVGQLGRQCTLR